MNFKKFNQIYEFKKNLKSIHRGPVVQRSDKPIQCINCFPADK